MQFCSTIKKRDLAEMFQIHYHLMAAYTRSKYVIIVPSSSDAVTVHSKTSVFFEALKELSRMKITHTSGDLPDMPNYKGKMNVTMSREQSDIFWSLLSKEWSTFSDYFEGNVWEFYATFGADGMFLTVTGLDAEQIRILGDKFADSIPGLTYELRFVS